MKTPGLVKKFAAAVKEATTIDHVPSVDDDPEYCQAFAVVENLRAQLADVVRQLQAIDRAPIRPKVAGQIERLLAGELIEDVDIATTDSRPERQMLETRRAMLEQALREAERRADVVRRGAVGRLLEHALPEVRDLQVQMAKALIALGLAVEASDAFLERLQNGASVDWPSGDRRFGPCGCGRVGHPTEEQSLPAQWLIAAVRCGAIELDVIPLNWREHWGVLRDLETRDPNSVEGVATRVKISKMANEASSPTSRQRSADRNARRAGSRGRPW